MASDKVVVQRGGIFLPLLQVLLIGLKLTNQIDWSWFWVFVPIWGTLVLVIGVVAIAFILFLIAAIIAAIFK